MLNVNYKVISMYYIAATYIGLKKFNVIEENGYLVICDNDEKRYVKKGDYVILDMMFNFQAIVSKSFFKENFKIQGRAYIKYECSNGKPIKSFAGLLCSAKENKCME